MVHNSHEIDEFLHADQADRKLQLFSKMHSLVELSELSENFVTSYVKEKTCIHKHKTITNTKNLNMFNMDIRYMANLFRSLSAE